MRFRSTLVVGILAIGACGSDRQQAATQPAVVTFTATDYAYAGPTEIPAGAVTLRLVNQGKELHHAVLARLEDGKTVDDVMQFYMERRATDPLLQEHPSFVTFLGGPGVGGPGSTIDATAVLTPGEYVLICYVESASDGAPHFEKGMTTAFRVTANDAPAPAPTANIDLALRDYAFTLSEPLTAGTHTLRVRNDGPQIHDVVLVRLESGATIDQFLQALAPGSTTPPPGELAGGLGGITKGETAYLTVTIEPATYVLLCFVPDARDGAPHFAHGMMQEIVVT